MEFLSFISEITVSSPVRQILGDQIFFRASHDFLQAHQFAQHHSAQ